MAVPKVRSRYCPIPPNFLAILRRAMCDATKVVGLSQYSLQLCLHATITAAGKTDADVV